MADSRPPGDDSPDPVPRETAPGESVGPAQPVDPGARRAELAADAPTTVRAPSDEPAATGNAPPPRPVRRQRTRSPSAMSAVDKVRRASFPTAMRGYDRASVDAYVAEVAQLVAELEATQLPETVVQRALDQVGDETSAILKHAHEASEEITARSREEAEDRLASAQREAELAYRDAEQSARRLEQDTQEVWEERRRLIEDIRHLADDVLTLADDALERLPPPAEDPSTIDDDLSPEDEEPNQAPSTVEVPADGVDVDDRPAGTAP